MRPRRIWEQQQIMIDVPFTACSTKYGRPAAPRAASICPGETLAAGRAVSEHCHGEAAASEAVLTCPCARVCADCDLRACPGAAAAAARAAPSPGHLPAADGGADMEVVQTIAKVKGTSGKGHAAQISKGRKG